MTQIKLRRDTAANFTSKNPVLGVGEPAYETDTKKLKIGDGTTAYAQLEYFSAGGGGSANIGSAPATQNLTQLDLNYVGTAGTYFYSGWSASVPKHTPISGIGDSFFLEIISNNGTGPDNRTLQRLTYNHESSHKGASYFRTGIQDYDSSWTTWVQITPAITS